MQTWWTDFDAKSNQSILYIKMHGTSEGKTVAAYITCLYP